MKRRIFLTALAVCLLLSACADAETAETKQPVISSALEVVQAIAPEEIESITYTRYTEGGAFSGSVADPESIKEICRRLSGIALGEESKVGTSDDGLHLVVKAGGEPRSLYFEGANLVIDDRQYVAEGLSPLKQYIDQLIDMVDAGETITPESTAQESPYQYWNYYNGYAYES